MIKIEDLDMIDLNEQARAFTGSSLPCNARPFLSGLLKGVMTEGQDWIKTNQAKSILWVINQMAYNEMTTIDMVEEWGRLKKLETFERLKELVLPTLEAYKDDLLKHDKGILESYIGPFIYGWRKTGTDLLKLYSSYEDIDINWSGREFTEEQKEEVLRSNISWVTYCPADRNKWFLHYDGKTFHEKTAQEVEQIYLDNVTRIMTEHRNLSLTHKI